MPASAPRISPRLVAAVDRIDDGKMPIAEVCRRLGDEAERLKLKRPSYERVRVLVHRSRRLRRDPTTASVALEVALRARPPEALLDQISGVGVPELRH